MELEWAARLSGGSAPFRGGLRLDDLTADEDDEDAYEVGLSFERQPKEDSEEETSLLNLLGPLAPRLARGAEGKLGRLVWDRVQELRQEFRQL